ncbi:uncharacterized protein LOC110737576 [Chenopodium quinoa]|uniref:uncharacterized protein LOC110737576 n=1 Tax=Chenopodium quinoa TaxID=63459 RepID=UPI000B7766A1|nr:uncharacterized protein LOC110737576 [Chenopodium quinoa]
MIVLSWNIRGLNDPGKVAVMKQLLVEHTIDVCCILETKVKIKSSNTIQRKFGRAWSWHCNYSSSPKGRIWVGWKADYLTLDVLHSAEQFVHCVLCSKTLQTKIFITFVYGLHTVHDRKHLWDGDFNAVLSVFDKMNGAAISNYETRDFQQCLDDLALVEIKSKGSFYSWCNKAHSGPRTFSRIDRGIVNQAWMNSYGHVEALYLPPSLSDHNPLVFNIFQSQPGKGKPFRVDVACAQLSAVLVQISGDEANTDLYDKEMEAIANVKHWLRIQESIYKQKSRIDWMQLGDGNNHYLFSVMKHRQRRNMIDTLYNDHDLLLNVPADIEEELTSFYKKLLGSKATSLPHVDLCTMRKGRQLSRGAQDILTSPVTVDEIDLALKGIDSSKAPGIDGLNSFFFKETWNIVKADVYARVLEFFRTGKMLKMWNCTTITLVPKVQNPSYAKDYRPIACCTVLYKLVSKILTARLALVLCEIIDEAQAGFISRKHI